MSLRFDPIWLCQYSHIKPNHWPFFILQGVGKAIREYLPSFLSALYCSKCHTNCVPLNSPKKKKKKDQQPFSFVFLLLFSTFPHKRCLLFSHPSHAGFRYTYWHSQEHRTPFLINLFFNRSNFFVIELLKKSV